MARYEELNLGFAVLSIFTTATLPDNATVQIGACCLVSDADAGNVYALVVNDGTNWIDVKTGVTVVA